MHYMNTINLKLIARVFSNFFGKLGQHLLKILNYCQSISKFYYRKFSMHSEKLLTRIEAKGVFFIKTNRSFGYDKNYFNVMKN